ncbi:hypothetical protein ACWGF3_15080 [Streptomyces xanthophaeus]
MPATVQEGHCPEDVEAVLEAGPARVGGSAVRVEVAATVVLPAGAVSAAVPVMVVVLAGPAAQASASSAKERAPW